ncbi:MAG: cbb3-type cytochrome c oxidase subunit 3 [bacterium]|nr:cbb3-type cytochrome c oxidase subunit 3 [bacterium]
MNYAVLHSIATVAAVIAFAGVCWWAYRPGNRKRFEEDALLPLQTDPLLTRAQGRAKEKSE